MRRDFSSHIDGASCRYERQKAFTVLRVCRKTMSHAMELRVTFHSAFETRDFLS